MFALTLLIRHTGPVDWGVPNSRGGCVHEREVLIARRYMLLDRIGWVAWVRSGGLMTSYRSDCCRKYSDRRCRGTCSRNAASARDSRHGSAAPSTGSPGHRCRQRSGSWPVLRHGTAIRSATTRGRGTVARLADDLADHRPDSGNACARTLALGHSSGHQADNILVDGCRGCPARLWRARLGTGPEVERLRMISQVQSITLHRNKRRGIAVVSALDGPLLFRNRPLRTGLRTRPLLASSPVQSLIMRLDQGRPPLTPPRFRSPVGLWNVLDRGAT